MFQTIIRYNNRAKARGLADEKHLEEYDWTDLTAFVCDDDCEG